MALIAGGFGVGGALGGTLLTGFLGRRSDRARLAADDARRWLSDRRQTCGSYLNLTESMLRQVDSVATFLPRTAGGPISAEYRGYLHDTFMEYAGRWDDELQPALHEVQLMALPGVADLADRVSGALMELSAFIEGPDRYGSDDYYPHWLATRDLVHLVRDAMRKELGLPELGQSPSATDDDWPWLPDRANPDTYRRRFNVTTSEPGLGVGQ